MVVTRDELDRARAAAHECEKIFVAVRNEASALFSTDTANLTDVEWRQQTLCRLKRPDLEKWKEHIDEVMSPLPKQVHDAIMVANAAESLPLAKLGNLEMATWHEASRYAAMRALYHVVQAAKEAANDRPEDALLQMYELVQFGDNIDRLALTAHIEREWAAAVASLRKADSADSADTSRLFPGGLPDDMDLQDLVIRLDVNKSRKPDERKSMNQIVREFFNETKECQPKTGTYLRQIRRMSERGEIIL
jgi:hypothetical protein